VCLCACVRLTVKYNRVINIRSMMNVSPEGSFIYHIKKLD